MAGALGAGSEDARELSGLFLVCKEYGTVRGTFLTSVRGRDITRLNYLFGEEVAPRLSPIGDRVLFTSARGGTAGLWTMNGTGEQQKRVCDGDQGEWFPDGRRILFRRQGQILERSLETGQETVLGSPTWKSCCWPACSPDGRTISFVRRDGPADSIWLLKRGALEPKRLVEGEILSKPRWSPAGERLVYQSGSHLWMIDAGGGNKRQLTTRGGVQCRPAWSPDGTAVAFCQGPGLNGPWQLAVTRVDGKTVFSIPSGDARSVLCSEWIAENPGRKRDPIGKPIPFSPRTRWWEIDCPASGEPVDWPEFCRQRKGWKASAAEDVLRRQRGCAIENDDAVFLLCTGGAGAVLVPKRARSSAIELTLLDAHGKDAGPIDSLRGLDHGPDEALLESTSRAGAARVKATWSIGGSRAMVRVAPVENAGRLRVAVRMQCAVLPDRFGNDIVADPEAPGGERRLLPWAPLVAGLTGTGSEMLVLVCPAQGQNVELRKGTGTFFAGAEVELQTRGVFTGMVACEGAWHLERVENDHAADPIRFHWRMPCAANWRLAVDGARQRYSTFFTDRESAVFDKKQVFLPRSSDFAPDVRLGVIYLYGRTTSTPPETLTPVDLLDDALGLKGARQALDEDGLTGYRRAARPTTWAELSVTIDSLRYLFERQLEVQDAAYARHLCDDLPAFVAGMDQRLKEYAGFSQQIQAVCGTSDKPDLDGKKSPDLAAVVRSLRELDQRQRSLAESSTMLPWCLKVRQLTAKESGENRREFEQCRQGLLRIAGPREELLKAYRKLAMGARDAVGVAPPGQAAAPGPAEKIRAICQGVLRNRFYTEADWRGEDYNVPAFWLGPRPYE